MMHRVLCIAAAVCAGGVCFAQGTGNSPQPGTVVKVGVLLEAPFVQKDAGGRYTGYSFELWERIEQKLGCTSKIREFDTFAALLDGVAAGAFDIAVADVFVTSDREKRMEFTHPIADGGLRVMVNAEPRHSFKRLWDGLVSNGHVAVFGYGAMVVVALSVLLMFLWRRIDKDFPRTPHDGFAESLYRTVSLTVNGKTKFTSVSAWYMKILSAVWLVIGVGIVAYITSSVTAVMTAEVIKHNISDVVDLGGKPVGVVRGTFGESHARRRGFEVVPYATLAEAVNGLVSHNVMAVIDDAPLLEAYDLAHPELAVKEVGPLFEKRKYAFAMPDGSPLRHPVNLALVELEEAGEVQQLHTKYFGGN